MALNLISQNPFQAIEGSASQLAYLFLTLMSTDEGGIGGICMTAVSVDKCPGFRESGDPLNRMSKISNKTDLFYWSEKGRWMSGCPATYS